MKKNNICEFVQWEIDFYRKECNFTADEGMFFDLRNEERSIEEIAEKMGYSVSKINDISRVVREKIIRVLPLKDAYLNKYCNDYS